MKKKLLVLLFVLVSVIIPSGCSSTPLSMSNGWIPVQEYNSRQTLIVRYNPFKETEILPLWRRVWMYITYKTDEGGDNWQSPLDTYSLRTGDCEDINILLASALYAEGFDVAIAVGNSDGKSGINHALVLLKYEGKAYYLDATTFEPPSLDGALVEKSKFVTRYVVNPVSDFNLKDKESISRAP